MNLKAFITITRPANPLFGSLTTIIGVLTTNRFILTNLMITQWTLLDLVIVLLLTALTYIFIAAAGNVVNDIFDIEVDKINRPDRPLPSGQISIGQAKAWTAILVVIGVIFSILTIPYSAIGIWTVAIVGLFALIGLVYAAKGKVMGIWGNFTVAISFAFGLFYGSLIVFPVILPIIFVYFITAASVLQGREAIKGIEDIEGDAVRNVQTIARKYGIRKAAMFATICNVIGIIGFVFPWIANILGWNWTGFLYFILLIPAASCVAYSAVVIVQNPVKRATRASFADKIGAYLGLVNFLLGTIVIA
ncbi:MAG: geranylgeranylglycerol-phosphate geranylgeranyltransferase [Candidatus Hodarchaeota archaeon]